jgi:hypothetical protein
MSNPESDLFRFYGLPYKTATESAVLYYPLVVLEIPRRRTVRRRTEPDLQTRQNSVGYPAEDHPLDEGSRAVLKSYEADVVKPLTCYF